MTIGIMQPYYLPYIGYFQLIAAVDRFVIYDDIQYTKKGWINRNRILQNGKDVFISLPISKHNAYAQVKDIYLAENFDTFSQKQKRMVEAAYRKAPYFETGWKLYNELMEYNDKNLFNFIFNSIKKVCTFLNIDTEMVVSSTLNIDKSLHGAERVMATCKALGAETYINPIGGVNLYDSKSFKAKNIFLKFIKTNSIIYNQFDNEFIPFLSILDIVMFNSHEKITSEILLNHSFSYNA